LVASRTTTRRPTSSATIFTSTTLIDKSEAFEMTDTSAVGEEARREADRGLVAGGQAAWVCSLVFARVDIAGHRDEVVSRDHLDELTAAHRRVR
jgi:hypothetical protein